MTNPRVTVNVFCQDCGEPIEQILPENSDWQDLVSFFEFVERINARLCNGRATYLCKSCKASVMLSLDEVE